MKKHILVIDGPAFNRIGKQVIFSASKCIEVDLATGDAEIKKDRYGKLGKLHKSELPDYLTNDFYGSHYLAGKESERDINATHLDDLVGKGE